MFLAGHPGAVGGDVYRPLVELWRLIRDNPQELSSHYRSHWMALSKELDGIDLSTMTRGNGIPVTFYEVRRRFNKDPNPFDLNFLMRTCVNGIVRFNDSGEFNNSFHLSRRGMIPEKFDSIIRRWRPYLSGVEFENCDYRALLDAATAGDFVYLDPPYAGTKQRYSETLNLDDLFAELDRLNTLGVKWALSFDGKRGEADFTYNVPSEIFKERLYLGSGNSAVRKVLSGPIERVEEALYINYHSLL